MLRERRQQVEEEGEDEVDSLSAEEYENHVPSLTPKDPFLVRCRWRLPFIIFIFTLLLLSAAICYYSILLQHLGDEHRNHKPHSGDHLVLRIVFASILLVLQVLSALYFLASFYYIVTIRAGAVPHFPWKHQPWYLNRRTFAPPVPLNSLPSIIAYHQNTQHPNIKKLAGIADPSADRRRKPQRSEEEAPEDDEVTIPDNVSPLRIVWQKMAPMVVELELGGEPTTRSTPVLPNAVDADGEEEEEFSSANPLHEEPHLPQQPRHPVCPAPISEQKENPYYVSVKQKDGHYRFCYQCHQFKPDLAYHCKVCGQCVFNFDHHCPYVDSCIGRNNYRTFLIFLMYASIATFHGFLWLLLVIVLVDDREGHKKYPWLTVCGLSGIVFIFMFRFFLKHVRMLYWGRTTMELIIQKRKVSAAKKAGTEPPVDPYDVLTAEERKEKGRLHRELLLGPSGWRRWVGLMVDPRPLRTDYRPTEILLAANEP